MEVMKKHYPETMLVDKLTDWQLEKHFTLSRDSGSPDDAFSLTPNEFKQMVESIRLTERIS